jgi:hypothetical protein
MQRAVGDGGGASRQTHRDNMNDRVQEEARTKKKRLVTQTLTNTLLNASPTPSCRMSSASPEATVSTTSVLEAFLREWREMDRCWVATDRLAGKVVLCTLYAALVSCPCFFCPVLLHANCIHISLNIPTYTYFCMLYMHIHAFYIIIYIYTHIYRIPVPARVAGSGRATCDIHPNSGGESCGDCQAQGCRKCLTWTTKFNTTCRRPAIPIPRPQFAMETNE